MKIKVIDIMNKIHNEEIVPKQIKYDMKTYFYDEATQDYTDYDRTYGLFGDLLDKQYGIFSCLNDEVEIIDEIEEEKKIPEKLTDILKVDDLIPPVDENMYKIWKQTIKNHNKINEICDYLKSKGE